jgi:hypothetical protein
VRRFETGNSPQAPVLLIAWRRPDALLNIITALRAVKPKHIFVACDGPRAGNITEAQRVAETRDVIENEIDWKCTVDKLYTEYNQGCKVGVSRAISWFFENVDEGIILEDDCVPHPDFFNYCTSLLEHYRNSERVWCISGNNFLGGQIPQEGSYYFSKYPHCWGWATWRRAWVNFSGTIDFWPEWKRTKEWREVVKDPRELQYWQGIFEKCYAGEIDSWAYPWTAAVWRAGAVTAIPNVNLVQNIGFDGAATHTISGQSSLSIATMSLPEIHHPEEVVVDAEADAYVFNTIFCPTQAHRFDSSCSGSGVLLHRLRRALPTLRRKLQDFMR